MSLRCRANTLRQLKAKRVAEVRVVRDLGVEQIEQQRIRKQLLDAIAGEHTSLGVAFFSSPVASHPDTLQFAANVGVHAALVTVESPKHARPLVTAAAAPSSAGVDPRQHGGGARNGRT